MATKKNKAAKKSVSKKKVSVRQSKVSNPEREQIEIAYIGGGSRGWARMLYRDLALCPTIEGRIRLYDIDHAAAKRNVKLAAEVFDHPDAVTRFSVSAMSDPVKALDGADFVIMSIEPGPIELFANDLDVPLRHGILQTVGDTTGPGGISRALRAIPVYLDYARLIMEHAPDAWVINYTNPMTLCTAALYEGFPDIKAIGCCHEVFGTQAMLARLVAKVYGLKEPPPRDEIRVNVSGVNHFTFAAGAYWRGVDLLDLLAKEIETDPDMFADQTEHALEQKRNEKWFSSKGLVARDFMRNFDALGAAGDRHLVEFVPWYLADESTLHRWGVIATPSSYRLKRARQRDESARRSSKQARAQGQREPLKGSGEEGTRIIQALLGQKPLLTNLNLPNTGQIADLPTGHIVETNALIEENRITPMIAGELQPSLQSHIRRVVENQKLLLDAAINADMDQVFEAVLSDPLVRISTDRALDMFMELMETNSPILKAYQEQVGWTGGH
ncbi:MAG: hypothetical protein JJU36_16435 [Phycisphaeraceae bacterium]|nr:hypothetical protein [Phycisphaeraceae bacterium]